jgi:hypothetical protein
MVTAGCALRTHGENYHLTAAGMVIPTLLSEMTAID